MTSVRATNVTSRFTNRKLEGASFQIDNVRLYAEPVSTIMLLLKAAGAVISIIRAFKKDTLEFDIAAPLKAIIDGIDAIMREMTALREFIPVALDDAFRKQLTISVATKMDMYEKTIAGLSDDQLRKLGNTSDKYKDIDRLANDPTSGQLANALNLRGYDFPGFFAVFTATMSYFSMCAVLRTPKAEIAKVNLLIQAWLKSIIDPANEKSAAAARNKMLAQANQDKSFIDGYPKRVWLGYYVANAFVSDRPDPGDRPDRQPREQICVNWYATFVGNIDSGIQWNLEGPDRSAGPNPRGWQLIPSEGNSNLHDRDESARARCRNNLAILAPMAERAKSLFARAKELDATIEGIKEMGDKIAAAAAAFK